VAAAVDASDAPNKGGVYVPKTAPTAKAAPKAAPRGGGAQGGAQVTGADSSARHDAADERHGAADERPGAQDDARRDAADERVQVDAVSLLAVREELKALAALWAYERRPLELKFRQTAAFAQRASLRVRWQGLPTEALDAAFGRPAIDVHMKRQPPSSIMHAHDDHAHLLDLPAAATGGLCIRH